MKKYIYAILLVLLVGCGDVTKVENKKPYVIVNGDTVLYVDDSVFVINPDSMDFGEEIQLIDTIVVKD